MSQQDCGICTFWVEYIFISQMPIFNLVADVVDFHWLTLFTLLNSLEFCFGEDTFQLFENGVTF